MPCRCILASSTTGGCRAATARRMQSRPRMLRLVLVALLICSAPPLRAQSRAAGARGEVPRAARVVINGVMSPYCPGLLLANCPSPSADSLRRAIVERAARGETEVALRAALVATYGPGVLAEPPARGFGLVAWLAPFALIVAGAAVLRRWLRRTGAPTPPQASPVAPSLDAADAARLDVIARLVRGKS